jgi:hypothetical protein
MFIFLPARCGDLMMLQGEKWLSESRWKQLHKNVATSACRSKSSPSWQGGLFSSIAFAALMIAREPSLVVVSLSICLQMLWRGRTPITGSTWSPSRAAKFDLENWGFSDSFHRPPQDAPRRPKAISS